jgi:carboxypeptidase C (cathepsin A)
VKWVAMESISYEPRHADHPTHLCNRKAREGRMGVQIKIGVMVLACISGGMTWSAPAAELGNSPESAATVQESDSVIASPREDSLPRRGQLALGGMHISYTVTPGTLTIRDVNDVAVASMFYVAYVVDRKPGQIRPVTFAFNGGPGTSSMWLLMSGLAAVRVDVAGDKSLPPAPYSILTSDTSILDKTDLVFIDAVGTGLSRSLGKTKPNDFWSVDADIDAFAKAVRRYIDLNKRWNSPKFLMGESYGALRAAGLAHTLQERGMQTNGVILVSAVLNMSVYGSRSDQEFVRYLPTYAAVAAYHKRLSNVPSDLSALVKTAQNFALGEYLETLARGDRLPVADRDRVAVQLAHLTGLSAAFLVQSNLRVPEERFRQELLRGENRIVGRIDARFAGIGGDPTAASPEYDAAETAIRSAFIAATNTYLFDTLGYQTSLRYRPEYYEAISDAWDFRHRQIGSEDVTAATVNLDLASVMRQNPHLKILEVHGYYDMATPFLGAELDLEHLELDPAIRTNLKIIQYESGHMIYIEPESRQQLSKDLKMFYDDVLQRR